MLLFDIEADGFYNDVTKIHCIVLKDTETSQRFVCNAQPGAGFHTHTLEQGLAMLTEADEIAGHNVLKYDIPVLQKLYPSFTPQGRVLDTLILTRLLFPELGETDDRLIKKCLMPGKHRGAHRLEAWGWRLGVMKAEYEGGFEAWSQEMEDYCVQDVEVTHALLNHCRKQSWPTEALDLEHAVTRIIARQEINGFTFDEKGARELLVVLSKERLELEDDLKARFGFWFARDGKDTFVPKKDDAKRGYTAGVPLTKVKAVYFNPGSRHHISRVLQRRFGWKPTSFTPSGEPEVNEEALKAIKHPEAATLIRYLMVQKRLGQLAEGKEAWLNFLRNGKIHGSVNVLGTVTGRMAHAHPNIAQVPAVRSPFGKECRALFSARLGWPLVGCDADALELRVLAHYMAHYDDGAYVEVVLKGDKKKGTDMHSVNCKAIGLDPTKVYRASETGRDITKTWFYAMIYGGGSEKLGMIISGERNKSKNVRLGRQSKDLLVKNLPAMGKLLGAISDRGKSQGFLKGIDGRRLHVRSAHSAPNTLFQSTGAVVMKKALVLLDDSIQQLGLVPGKDYEFVANIHDEWQIECRPELAETIGPLAVQAIRDAGSHFRFRCPLDGEFCVGRTWADTH
jgi:DNA polymerase-1